MIEFSRHPPREQRPIDSAPFHEYRFDDGSVWTQFFRLAAGYLLRFPGLADFEIAGDGKSVVAHATGGTHEATVEHLYLNQVIPLALSRQGRPAYHASVVTVPGGCVAFLGRSGMGKSTLAASFALSGAAFLTDDSLVVDDSDERILALPGHASLRLWEDSVDRLVGDDTARAGRTSYSSKARLLAGPALAHRDSASPLLAAFVLDNSEPDEVTIRPIVGSQRHMAWVQHSFLLDIQDRDLLSRHFEWTHRIAARVPTFGLDYTRDYDALARVRRAVQHQVANPGQGRDLPC